MDWRKLVILVFVGWLGSATYADMVPVFRGDFGQQQAVRICDRTDDPCTSLCDLSNNLNITNMDLCSAEFLPNVSDDPSQSSEIQYLQLLTNGSGSLNLCLSALIGLGLCASAQWVKRLSFGFSPEWYHDGGPFQIGHSYAVMPEFPCPAPVCCFIQPGSAVEESLLQYHLRTVSSFAWTSQFLASIVESRGPPKMA